MIKKRDTKKYYTGAEVLYRKQPDGTFEPVCAAYDSLLRFSPGRYVIVVENTGGSIRKSLPYLDDGVYAVLVSFQNVLADAIQEASKRDVAGNVAPEVLTQIRELVKDSLVRFTLPSAYDIADKAVKMFAEKVLVSLKDIQKLSDDDLNRAKIEMMSCYCRKYLTGTSHIPAFNKCVRCEIEEKLFAHISYLTNVLNDLHQEKC